MGGYFSAGTISGAQRLSASMIASPLSSEPLRCVNFRSPAFVGVGWAGYPGVWTAHPTQAPTAGTPCCGTAYEPVTHVPSCQRSTTPEQRRGSGDFQDINHR